MLSTCKATSQSHQILKVVRITLLFDRSISSAEQTTDHDLHNHHGDGVDLNDYLMPENYNLSEIVHEINCGKGFYILRNVFSESDIEKAKEIVDYCTQNKRIDTNTDTSPSAKHNSYGGKVGGIIWRLLGKGPIMEKLAQHPATLEVTRALLGPKSQISSYMSNTVLPGMGGQLPHLDYPYYDGYFPAKEEHMPRPLLSVAFMIMLSKFDIKNGGTAFRPYSQKNPSYPNDNEEFFRHMVQLEGEPGDVGIFAASTQHCAMQNNGISPRVGIVQSMVPVYLKPYHDLRSNDICQPSKEMRTLLAADHPYPMKH